MIWNKTIRAGGALTLAFLATGANGQVMLCLSHEKFAEALLEDHGEYVLGSGATAPGAKAPRVEMWVDPSDGSWTMLTIDPNGLTCMRAAGKGWTLGARGEPA